MKPPKYVIDNAKYRLRDQWGDFDIKRIDSDIERIEKKILELQEELKSNRQRKADIIDCDNNLAEWLKSIGEYEEPKTDGTL